MATDVVSRVTTIIAAVDKTTAVVNAIQKKLVGLANTARGVGDRFRAMSERTGLNRLPGVLGTIHEKAVEAAKSFGEMALKLVGLGAGGVTAASLLDLAAGLETFIHTGSRLNVVSQRIGTTVENLQNLEHAAELMNVPAEVMDTNLARLNKNLAQVAVGKNKEATKLLGFLGISARDAKGHIRSAADVMPQIADAFARIHNPAQRARLAVGLFQKGGQALIPVLIQGSRGLAAARADMEKLGRMSAHEAEQAHELEISQTRLRLAFKRVQEIIGAALAPYVKKATDYFINLIGANRKVIQQHVDEWAKRAATWIGHLWKRIQEVHWKDWLDSLKQWGQYLLDVINYLGGVNRLLLAFAGLLAVSEVVEYASALVKVAKAFKFITLAMYENPYLAVGAALITLAILIYKNWNQIAHWMRYYQKVIVKEATFYWHSLEDLIARHLNTTRENVQRWVDDIVDYFTSGWRQIADNPLVKILGTFFGIGIPGAVSMLSVPLGAVGQYGGPRGATYPPPPAGASPVGPYRGAYRYAGTNGNVNVDVSIGNAPPGTRAQTKTSGTGLTARTSISHSMPQTQRGAR